MLNNLRSLILLAAISQTAMSPALACLWPEGEHYEVGRPVKLTGLDPAEYVRILSTGHQSQDYWKNNLESVSKFINPPDGLDASPPKNNIAVAMIHLGRSKEAIKILSDYDKQENKQYYTAANLGTAYELVGDNTNALKWIKESIARDADAHYGTEWVHVKILEAKLNLEKDPSWFNSNSVLGIDWNKVSPDLTNLTVTDGSGKQHSAQDIQKALEYQLHERTEFVKPPDAIVTDLLHDLAIIVGQTTSSEHRAEVMKLANSYGQISDRKTPAWAMPQEPKAIDAQPSTYSYLKGSFIVGFGLIFVAFITFLYLRRRRLN